MAHQAETILAAIVTILKAGSTDAGTAVYRGRTLPVEAAENSGDVINVYEGDETSALDDVNFKKTRELQVFVELHKRALPSDQNDPGSIDTAMNDFYREVEVALEASPSLSASCLWFEHTGTQRERDKADREYRVLTLNLLVHYRTVRTNPAVQA
jgi:hypothetical protein